MSRDEERRLESLQARDAELVPASSGNHCHRQLTGLHLRDGAFERRGEQSRGAAGEAPEPSRFEAEELGFFSPTMKAAESLGAEPRGDLRRWARAVIDAGADAVVGHGPHVLRGMEFYRGRLIAYSLGNFLTYRGFNLTGPLGITGVLQLEFTGERTLRRARLVPMLQIPQRGPVPDADGAAVQLVRRLSAEDFGPNAAIMTGSGEIRPPASPKDST